MAIKPAAGTANELPFAMEIGAPIHVPHIHLTGVPAWSHSSIPLIVQPPAVFVHVAVDVLYEVGTPETRAAAPNVQAVPPVTYPLPLGSSVMSADPDGDVDPSRRLIPVVDAVADCRSMALSRAFA